MSVLPLSNFRRTPYSEFATKVKAETFKDFFNKLWSDVDKDITDTQMLIRQVCEKFDLDGVTSLIDYVDERLSDNLKALFFEITQAFHFTHERLVEIRTELESEVHKPSDVNNGVNQCVAMWLLGAYEAAFNETYHFNYLYASYTLGATLPFFNGEIPTFTATEIKTESEYKDRVIISALINDIQTMVRKAIVSIDLFNNSDISELGNPLRTDASLFGFGCNLIYNSMRLVVQQHYTMPTMVYFLEYSQFNPRYHTNKDTLKDISEKYPEFNVADEFNKTFSRMINALTLANMSEAGALNLPVRDAAPRILATLIKDYQFIKDYLGEYCHETQIRSLKKQMVDVCFFIYKKTVKNLSSLSLNVESVEFEMFELLSFFEDLSEQVYGPENKMAHIVYAMKNYKRAITPINLASVLDQHAPPGQVNIDDENMRKIFKIAVDSGSISAKMQLRCVFNTSKKNTVQNLKLALDWDAEDIEKKYLLGAIGGTYDLVGLFLDNKDNAGELSETIRNYIRTKVLEGDLSYPEFAVRLIKEIKEKAIKDKHNIELREKDWSTETLDDWRDHICKYFPYLRNRMLTHKDITAECAMLSLLGELGSPLATVSLNCEAQPNVFFEQLAPICLTLDKLTNPKTMPYYLMTDNWFRYAISFNELLDHHPKNETQIVEYIKRMFLEFEEFELHIQSIIVRGEMPSIELSGIGVNFIHYLLHLSYTFNGSNQNFDRHLHRETTEYIYNFWANRSSLYLNAVSISKLSDFISGQSNRLLIGFIKSADLIRASNHRVNILSNPITSYHFLDSLAEFTPNFDSPLGLIYTIYLSYIEKALYAAMEEENHIECVNANYYCRYLYGLICSHSNVSSDVADTLKHTPTTSIDKKHLGHIDRQGRSKALTAHQVRIDATRKILNNIKPLDLCVLELKKMVMRGGTYAAQTYHLISTSNLNNRETFMPFDSKLLEVCISTLSQRPTIDYLTKNQFLVSKPYMCLALFLYDEEKESYQFDEDMRLYLLEILVRYGDIFAIAYDAYTATISKERISMTGVKLHDAIELLRQVTLNNKSLIQVLESAGTNEFSYKFIHAKQKTKVQDITPKDWMYAFMLSPSAKFLHH